MPRHALDVIQSIREDREKGLTISQLIEKHSLPKTTVWHHIRGIELPPHLLEIIRSKQGGSAIRSKKDWELAEKEAKKITLDKTSTSMWPGVLAALYWSEGTKNTGFVFTNTDAAMIKVFLTIMKEYLNVDPGNFDVMIRVTDSMNPLACRRYWSRATGVPLKDVHLNFNNKHNKSKTQFGMCRLTLRKGGYHLKLIHCLIRELTAKMLAV